MFYCVGESVFDHLVCLVQQVVIPNEVYVAKDKNEILYLLFITSFHLKHLNFCRGMFNRLLK